MDFFQSDWFVILVSIIVIGGIFANFFDAFENAGFDEGVVWGFTKKFLKLTIGFILLPIIIPIMIFSRKD